MFNPARTALFAFILLGLGSVVQAQQGMWVEHAYTTFGSGSRLNRAGDTCLGFTYETSSRLLFFDINSGVWSETELATEQEWIYFTAVGNLVYAVSDTLLVAYNAHTSLCHTHRYEGTPLSFSTGNESFRCGKKLAYMITDEKLYVFDAVLDTWREYDYEPPPGYNGVCNSGVRDTYVVISLNQPWPDRPKTIVYSLPMNAFNETDHGVLHAATTRGLDFGFAGTTGGEANTDLMGYSALSNDFALVEVNFDHEIFNTSNPDPELKGLCTAFAISCSEVIIPFDTVEHHMWGYDTRRGCWTY